MASLLFEDPAKIQPYIGSTGTPYTQLYQHIPLLSPLYTDLEKNFVAKRFVDFAKGTWPLAPLGFCAVYALMIVVGKWVMKNRKPFGWQNALAHWNLLLSLFSFTGMLRTVPHLLFNIATLPFKDTICTPAEAAYGEGACGLWVMLFIFSKIPELVDTVFIVFRKKELMFLHWYHHITVLLFCWHSYAYTSSTGLYFVAMNFSVHAIMYGYYYLMAIKAWPKWMPSSLITVAQISQMVVGTSVCIASYIYKSQDGASCAVEQENILAGALMYGSYLYLFSEFFVRRFIWGSKSAKKEV